MLVLKSEGQGRAIVAGSFIGLAYQHFRNPNNGRFLTGLADWLGIKPDPEIKTVSENLMVEAKYLEGPDYRLLFVFNRSEEKGKAQVLMTLSWKEVNFKDLETAQSVAVNRQGDRFSLELELQPRQVKVFLVEKAGKK